MDSESSMSFQKVVLIVAVIALIITLSFMGYMMYYTAQSQPFPPIDSISKCPDKWLRNASGECTTTTDGKNFGNVILADKYCVIGDTSGDMCDNGILAEAVYKTAQTCVDPWVRGNVSNDLKSTNCYLLARGWKGSTPLEIKRKMKTLDKDIEWAKKYNITWDGFN